MSITATDLIVAAIQRLTADSNLPSPDDTATALLRLNDLIDAWKIEGLTVYTISRVLWTLSTAASYTVGTGATINIDRPVNASRLRFGLLDSSSSPALERAMANYTEQQYQAIGLKTLTSPYPKGFYYNPTMSTGTMIPWPVPTASNLQGVVYASAPAGELALTDVLALPQGYRRFYRDNLAVELETDFGVKAAPSLVQSAIDSKAMVKRANVRISEMSNEGAALNGSVRSGWYDIYADTP